MKKFNRLINKLIVVILIFVFSITTVFASNSTYTKKSVISIITNRVENFISVREGNDFSVDKFKPLLNENKETISYCFFLNPEGYVIVDINGNVIEAAFEKTKSYEALVNNKGDIYYAGPLNYYSKNDNCYVNALTKRTIKPKDFNTVASEFSNVTNRNSAQLLENNPISPRLVTTNRLEGTLRTYSYNTGVICGSTAAAIMLMYYDDYRDSNMVPSWHATNTGESLIELIRPEINGDPPEAATCPDVVNGLNYYFRWRGVSDQYSATWASGSASEATYNALKNLITANKPAEILIQSHPKYGNHFVVVSGVEKEYHGSNNYYYVYVGDGWGSNNVLISMTYLYGYIYING